MTDTSNATPPLESNNLAYLRTHFESGRVVLFAGAGFSIDATNAEGQSPPLGGPLAERLAKAVGHEYAGEPLPTVFSVAARRMGSRAFNDLLTSLYSITGFNEWYGLIPSFVWHRIYTTNVDDLLEKVFAGVREQRPNRIDVHGGIERQPAQLTRRRVAEAIGGERVRRLVHRQRRNQHCQDDEDLC